MIISNQTKVNYGYTIVETNSENIDPSQALYVMSDEQFENYLGQLHAAKLEEQDLSI